MTKLVVLSGCSGGGKTTLLEELARRGYPCVPEPGRRVILAEEKAGGEALPWENLTRFAEAAMRMAMTDIAQWSESEDWVFCDRGLVDAAAALAHLSGNPLNTYLKHMPRYHTTVFMTPPWAEIYRQDDQRRHDFTAAKQEYDRLLQAYPDAGYEPVVLAKVSVQQRADDVLRMLGKFSH